MDSSGPIDFTLGNKIYHTQMVDVLGSFFKLVGVARLFVTSLGSDQSKESYATNYEEACIVYGCTQRYSVVQYAVARHQPVH